MKLIQFYVKLERLKTLAEAASVRKLGPAEKQEFDELSELDIVTTADLIPGDKAGPFSVRIPFEGTVS